MFLNCHKIINMTLINNLTIVIAIHLKIFLQTQTILVLLYKRWGRLNPLTGIKHFILASCFLFTLLATGQNAIENKILDTYSESIEQKQDKLASLIQQLKSKKNNNYWISFALYKEASLYGHTKEEKALSKLNEAIELLKNKKNKNSEDYALLGFMTSYTIKFQSEIAAIISAKASEYYHKSLKLDKNNFRAYLGLGKSDFYRPLKYGGGLRVESYLKQAMVIINSPNAKNTDSNWGKDEVYYYLIRYYQKSDMKNEAALYYNLGIKNFPESTILKTLADK